MIPEIKDLKELDALLEKRIKDKKIQTYNDFKKLLDEYSDPELEKAVNLLYENIINKKRIIGIHDSDTDGLGTATLSYRFYKNFIPYPIKIVITDRQRGYGFIPEYIDEYPGDLYFTADNGITSFDACKKAKELNKQVIINDHHQPEKEGDNILLPEADAIFDPWIPGNNFEFKEISGTVVYFIMLWKLLDKFNINRKDDFFKDSIDLLALTTLSDVMPLNISINRFLVKEFIDNHFNESKFEYINLFRENFNNSPVASDFSFTLVPALNATQRMSSPIYGFHFLIQEDKEKAQNLMNYLFSLNDKRKEIQQQLLEYIEKYYKDWIKNKKFILIPGKFKKEYDGILGIVAGRLAEKYKRPAIVCNIKSDGNFAGSGRSIGDIDILSILREIREENEDIFTHIGGHKQACGIGFKPDKLNELFLKLQEKAEEIPEEKFRPKKKADFYININQIDIYGTDLYYELLKWEPFGERFPKPVFKTRAYISNYRIIGKNKNHLTLTITDKNNIINLKALWFFFDQDKIKILDEAIKDKKYIHIIWQPELDTYGGQEKLNIRVFDIELPDQ